MNYIAFKPIPLMVQLYQLRRQFPEGSGSIVKSRLIWEQKIRPQLLAHTYHCRFTFRPREYPIIECLDPQLSVIANGRRLPHVYDQSEPVSLCLFMHRRDCWDDDMSVAKVVVPLAFYWLANFEDWLFSGTWRGGGTHEIPFDPPTSPPIFPSELAEPSAQDKAVQEKADEPVVEIAPVADMLPVVSS